MEKTIPAENIGQEELGYVLLALLSDNARAHVARLLAELSRELPGVLWLMPPEALHITLCEIIQPKNYGTDKEVLYQENKQLFEVGSRDIISGFGKISVIFDTIEASPGGVIVRGHDGGSFNAIRARLTAGLPLPSDTKKPPDIVHSSIARYRKSVDLGKVQRVVSRHEILFEEVVTEFVLARCTVQPLLQYETLQRYSLK